MATNVQMKIFTNENIYEDLFPAVSNTIPGIIPIGGIIMWSGAVNNIPQYWALCNGTNGTPDLRNRFIVGAGSSYAVGAKGGSDSVTLTVEQMPSHTHTVNTDTSANDSIQHIGPAYESDSHAVGGNGKRRLRATNYASFQYLSGSGDSDRYFFIGSSISLASTGSSQSHENRPPYYALCFIMRIG